MRRLLGRLALAAVMALGMPTLVRAGSASGFVWGANGHPIVSYPDITIEQQLDFLQDLGMTSYRVDVVHTDHIPALERLVRAAKPRGIDILPVITPGVDLEQETADALYAKARQLAFTLVSHFKSDVRIWELGNELEVFAIIKACETQDNGQQYNCAWGPAGGVGPLEYYGPRWAKSSAVLKGLSDGAMAADPTVLKAMGTAGWGHVGAFELMQRDGIQWDISVWHMYGDDPEWAFTYLARYGRPIWVTELNHPYGSQNGAAAQAAGLKRDLLRLLHLREKFDIQAVHVYELLDEPYWAPDFEAFMGLVTVEKTAQGKWAPLHTKPAYADVKALIGAYRGGGADGALRLAQLHPGERLIARRCKLRPLHTQVRNITVEQQIDYIYCLVLGRAADGGGARDYTAAMSRGQSILDIAAGFFASDEFAQNHATARLDDAAFVALVYRLLLGREPDGGGLTGYLRRLDDTSARRNDIASSIISSDEFRTQHPILFAQAQLN